MRRRVGETGGLGTLDWRIVLIGGVLLIGAIVLLVVFLFAGTGGGVGQRMVDEGREHVPVTDTPTYQSVPATSGPHWSASGLAPVNWGVYANPVLQPAAVHNLEHGGIVIWYDPTKLNQEGIDRLTTWVEQQVTTSRYKVILSPWDGQDFGHPIAVTAWTWLLYLDSADIGQIETFVNDHYGHAPENLGGPGPPA